MFDRFGDDAFGVGMGWIDPAVHFRPAGPDYPGKEYGPVSNADEPFDPNDILETPTVDYGQGFRENREAEVPVANRSDLLADLGPELASWHDVADLPPDPHYPGEENGPVANRNEPFDENDTLDILVPDYAAWAKEDRETMVHNGPPTVPNPTCCSDSRHLCPKCQSSRSGIRAPNAADYLAR